MADSACKVQSCNCPIANSPQEKSKSKENDTEDQANVLNNVATHLLKQFKKGIWNIN